MPIGLSAVSQPPELHAPSERLAENLHNIWAAQRMADGWTFGAQRDDAGKGHPCLVPYAELPESEMVYGRKVVDGVLKAIVVLGNSVEPPKAE